MKLLLSLCSKVVCGCGRRTRMKTFCGSQPTRRPKSQVHDNNLPMNFLIDVIIRVDVSECVGHHNNNILYVL